VSLSIRTVRFSKESIFGKLEKQSLNLECCLFLKHSSNLGQMEYHYHEFVPHAIFT
jgi:hypothetical protein